MVTLLVHGGAWDIPDSEWTAHQQGCRAAYEHARCLLESGASAVEAAVAAVRLMEDDPTFDAGYGSFLTADGRVELDACVMRGSDLAAGGVMGVSRLRNPVLVARAIMERSPYLLFAGAGAEAWARTQGFELVPEEALVHPREGARWEAYQTGRLNPDEAFGMRDTVGAVARDAGGHFAVATSTGGNPYKPPGRVGDCPLPGCGAYADDEAGAAAVTGHGEPSIRMTLARHTVDLMRAGLTASEATRQAVGEAHRRLGARLGIIAIDRDGGAGWFHTTPRLALWGP
ncbi:MAG: isoaspartyl peptidase/L-asparaginase [Planctomycetota bacterium]